MKMSLPFQMNLSSVTGLLIKDHSRLNFSSELQRQNRSMGLSFSMRDVEVSLTLGTAGGYVYLTVNDMILQIVLEIYNK